MIRNILKIEGVVTMEYTLTQNSSLKTKGFFKKIIKKLFFITVFLTGVICTNYALDRLFSIYPSLLCISALAEHLFRKHSNTQNGFARTPITVSVEQ